MKRYFTYPAFRLVICKMSNAHFPVLSTFNTMFLQQLLLSQNFNPAAQMHDKENRLLSWIRPSHTSLFSAGGCQLSASEAFQSGSQDQGPWSAQPSLQALIKVSMEIWSHHCSCM